MGSLRRRLRGLDQLAFERVAGTRSSLLDDVLPRLSVAANYGRLWMGVAALLALSGRRDARRAAVRGMVSLGVASVAANIVAKELSQRARPHHGVVPVMRRLRRPPVTTSFPSGHSASAAAFATAAGLEMPALAVPLGVVAAGVVVSRVATGAHYPSDVIAGAAVGVTVSLLLRRRLRKRSTPSGRPRF
jgi:membrane-associated phospholipid phosphatase